jgi:hypothetical protein
MNDKRKYIRIMIPVKLEIIKEVDKKRKTETEQAYLLECVDLHMCQTPDFRQTEKMVLLYMV